MSTYLGIDGGGTRTRAFVMDETGRRGAWGQAGLTNPNHVTAEELRANLGRALREAFEQAGWEMQSCTAAFAGMAGVTTEEGGARVRAALAECGLGQARISVDHDIRIALAGGLAGRPGLALIVGTGSSCYGRTADGRTWQTGGWEALISDEGSAYFLGREAIAASARMADGRSPDSELRKTVFQWLGIEQIPEILPRIHDRGLSRSEIAAFAPQLIGLAEAGDAAALEILERGSQLLAEMVAANHRMLPTGPSPDVVITGGLGASETRYRDQIVAAIRARLPGVRIHPPILAPAIGAALLALQETGLRASAELIENLKQFSR